MLLPLSIGLSTTPFSVLFRGTIVGISILVCLTNLVKIDTLRIHKGYFFLFIFWSIYSIRLIYDLSISPIHIGKQLQSANHIYLFAIGSTFIPIISLLFLNQKISVKHAERGIFFFSLFQILAIIYIFFFLYGLSFQAFLSRHFVTNLMDGSDIGQPINPIIVSKSGGYLALFSLVYKPNIRGSKLIRIMAFILGLGLLILGASRGPLVAFIASALFFILYYIVKGRKNLKWIYTIFLSTLISILIGTLVYNLISELDISILTRVMRTFDSSSQYQGADRLGTWASAWNQFLDSPIIGDQIVERQQNSYPHNLILEVLMSTGLVGFVPFFMTIYYAFRTGYKFFKKGHKVIFILFLYGFSSMMFSGAIFLSPDFWITISLLFIIKQR